MVILLSSPELQSKSLIKYRPPPSPSPLPLLLLVLNSLRLTLIRT